MQPLDPLAVPLEGVRLLEASAGTGKTWTIAALYLRLLLERGLEVPEILVVTFTQAATEELRERIRGRVRDALAVAEGRKGDDEFAAALLARAGPSEDPRQRLVDALARMDELAVFTIHGFCQRVLQENAFESGALFDAEVGADERDLRREVMEDFWRRRLYGASAPEAARLLEEWKDPGSLLRQVGGLVGPEPVELLPVVDPPAAERARAAAHAAARREWAAGREAVRGVLESGVLNRTSYKPEKVARVLAAAEAEFGATAAVAQARFGAGVEPVDGEFGPGMPALDAPEGGEAELFQLLTPERISRATKTGHPVSEHPFFAACAAWLGAEAEAVRARRVALLREAAGYLAHTLEARKSERRVLFFDDLLLHLDRALSGPAGGALVERLRRQYPAALIDEFQDTDAVQYRIFRAIYADAPASALFLIGDPKQAIYGFRGADVFTYLRAGRDVDPRSGRFTLTHNWRSSTPFVQAVNTLFARVERPFLFEDIPFHPAVAAGKGDRAPLEVQGPDGFRAPAALSLWFLEREEPAPGKKPGKPRTLGKPGTLGKGVAQERAAAACAEAIAGWLELGEAGRARLEGRALEAADLAVLVRTRYEAEAVRRALARVGVASVHYSRESVYASEEAGELAQLLAALAAPEDAGLMRAALATRLLGRGAEEIAALAGDEEAWEATGERFRAWAADGQAHGLMAMLQRVLEESGAAGRILAAPGGERRLTNLLQLAELLQGEAGAWAGFETVLRTLTAAREGAEAGGEGGTEEEQLRLESDEKLVRIVTLHRSKGLEYPVVFLPFPWSAKDGSGSLPVRFHDPATGALRADLASPPAPRHVEIAERERLAEELRLLYVGLTRARYRCTLTWGAVNGADATGLAYLLHGPAGERVGLADLRDAEVRAALDALAADAAGTIEVSGLPPPRDLARRPLAPRGPALAARAFTGRVDRSWRVASFSGLAGGRETERPDHDAAVGVSAGGAAPVADRGAPTFFDFPRGTRAGTCLHALLEALDFPTARGEGLARTVADQLDRFGFAPEWQGVLAGALEGVLDTPLDASGLRLRGVDRAHRLDELEFWYPLARLSAGALEGTVARFAGYRREDSRFTFSPVRGLMHGFLDLVFEWAGRYYLADYKSTFLGGRPEDYAPERLATAMAEHRYDLQYLVYTVALHRFLGTRVPDYDYERHFGGVYYLFLRGLDPAAGPDRGVCFVRPPLGLVEALDALFAGTPGRKP